MEFLTGVDEVLCVEELDPVIERELTYLCGKYHLPVKIYGKLTHHVANAGENTVDSVAENVESFLHGQPEQTPSLRPMEQKNEETQEPPALPVRPPVLCAGCPHRASFYAVKKGHGREKDDFLRRYWLLYHGKCHAP